jgi:hypothetical protein
MATVASVGLTVLFTYGGANNANPINATGVQIVTPWGKSSVRSSLYECFEDVMFPGASGGGQAGVLGSYLTSQTLNGATGTGPTGFTNANEV